MIKMFLIAVAFIICSCGEDNSKEKDYVDVPAIITYIDAGTDADAGKD